MTKFQPGNKIASNPKNTGRPRRLARVITEVVNPAELRALVRKAYEDAVKQDGPSRVWFLSQMKQDDDGARLPTGLPKLDSLKACVEAMSVLGDMARQGKLTVTETEKAVGLLSSLAAARMGLLARASEKLDAELRAAIEQERRLETQALPVPAWSPGGETVN